MSRMRGKAPKRATQDDHEKREKAIITGYSQGTIDTALRLAKGYVELHGGTIEDALGELRRAYLRAEQKDTE